MNRTKFRQPIRGIAGSFIRWHYWGILWDEKKKDWIFVPPHTSSLTTIADIRESYQFTGRKDDEGQETYDGDIMEWFSSLVPKGGNPNKKATVKWSNKLGRWEGCYNGVIVGNIVEGER